MAAALQYGLLQLQGLAVGWFPDPFSKEEKSMSAAGLIKLMRGGRSPAQSVARI